jgi:hypothetical protein
MKAGRTVYAIPVGQRDRRHLQLNCALDQLLRQRRSRKKAERACGMQFNVFAVSPTLPRAPSYLRTAPLRPLAYTRRLDGKPVSPASVHSEPSVYSEYRCFGQS